VEVAGATWEETTAIPRNVQHSVQQIGISTITAWKNHDIFHCFHTKCSRVRDGIARWYASARRYRPLLEVRQVVNVT
jgi:hypothetical protein